MPRIYDPKYPKGYIDVDHINGYLMAAPDIYVEKRKTPLCNVPPMIKGSQPTDGGNLIINADEYDDFIKREPNAKKYIRRYMGADDLINNKFRYCLWLVDCPPNEIRKMPLVYERVKAVRQYRLTSKKSATRKLADKPSLFTEIRQPDSDYLMLPVVSSENRKYVPMAYVSKDVIANSNAQMIPNATVYLFGILNSLPHMAWMRVVCGRLESRYAYSSTIVYNNFPFCTVTNKQHAKIESTAQAILNARANYPDASLADLYDENTMPPDLRDAHNKNDRAVMQVYGYDYDMFEEDIVADLLQRYSQMTD